MHNGFKGRPRTASLSQSGFIGQGLSSGRGWHSYAFSLPPISHISVNKSRCQILIVLMSNTHWQWNHSNELLHLWTQHHWACVPDTCLIKQFKMKYMSSKGGLLPSCRICWYLDDPRYYCPRIWDGLSNTCCYEMTSIHPEKFKINENGQSLLSEKVGNLISQPH